MIGIAVDEVRDFSSEHQPGWEYVMEYVARSSLFEDDVKTFLIESDSDCFDEAMLSAQIKAADLLQLFEDMDFPAVTRSIYRHKKPAINAITWLRPHVNIIYIRIILTLRIS